MASYKDEEARAPLRQGLSSDSARPSIDDSDTDSTTSLVLERLNPGGSSDEQEGKGKAVDRSGNQGGQYYDNDDHTVKAQLTWRAATPATAPAAAAP